MTLLLAFLLQFTWPDSTAVMEITRLDQDAPLVSVSQTITADTCQSPHPLASVSSNPTALSLPSPWGKDLDCLLPIPQLADGRYLVTVKWIVASECRTNDVSESPCWSKVWAGAEFQVVHGWIVPSGLKAVTGQ